MRRRGCCTCPKELDLLYAMGIKPGPDSLRESDAANAQPQNAASSHTDAAGSVNAVARPRPFMAPGLLTRTGPSFQHHHRHRECVHLAVLLLTVTWQNCRTRS